MRNIAPLLAIIGLAVSVPLSLRSAPQSSLPPGLRVMSERSMVSTAGGYGQCPTDENACNDPDGCIGVQTDITYRVHYPQIHCNYWPGLCSNDKLAQLCWRNYGPYDQCPINAPGPNDPHSDFNDWPCQTTPVVLIRMVEHHQ